MEDQKAQSGQEEPRTWPHVHEGKSGTADIILPEPTHTVPGNLGDGRRQSVTIISRTQG